MGIEWSTAGIDADWPELSTALLSYTSFAVGRAKRTEFLADLQHFIDSAPADESWRIGISIFGHIDIPGKNAVKADTSAPQRIDIEVLADRNTTVEHNPDTGDIHFRGVYIEYRRATLNESFPFAPTLTGNTALNIRLDGRTDELTRTLEPPA